MESFEIQLTRGKYEEKNSENCAKSLHALWKSKKWSIHIETKQNNSRTQQFDVKNNSEVQINARNNRRFAKCIGDKSTVTRLSVLERYLMLASLS